MSPKAREGYFSVAAKGNQRLEFGPNFFFLFSLLMLFLTVFLIFTKFYIKYLLNLKVLTMKYIKSFTPAEEKQKLLQIKNKYRSYFLNKNAPHPTQKKIKLNFIVIMLFLTYFINQDFNSDNLVLFSVLPAAIYANADTDKVLAIKENKKKSGVYKWKNLINNKIYIGSSVDLSSRLYKYFNLNRLIEGPEKNKPICRALVKYGHSNFQLEIIEYCASADVVKREQYYIDLLKPEYNILKIAGSSLGYLHSSESLAKMSGKNHVMFGKKHSENTKEKIRQSLISDNHPSALKVSVLDLETNIETIYGSRREASRALNCHESTFRYYLKNDSNPYKKRYIIKKIANLNMDSNKVLLESEKFDKLENLPSSPCRLAARGKDNVIDNLNNLPNEGIAKTDNLKVFDDKGLLVNSFHSLKECALFFNVSTRTINRRIIKNTYFSFNGKILKINHIK